MDKEKNDKLGNLLREWQVDATLPEDFKNKVWSRVALAQSKSSPWRAFASWLESSLPRPLPALSYASVLLAFGVVAGVWKGQQDASQFERHLATRYVQSVDPYQSLSR